MRIKVWSALLGLALIFQADGILGWDLPSIFNNAKDIETESSGSERDSLKFNLEISML